MVCSQRVVGVLEVVVDVVIVLKAILDKNNKEHEDSKQRPVTSSPPCCSHVFLFSPDFYVR